jgi:hypothetical protein
MKKGSYTTSYLTRLIADNGNTCFISFPYKKDKIPLTSDLTNNSYFLSPLKEKEQRSLGSKIKQKNLQFDFSKLAKTS